MKRVMFIVALIAICWWGMMLVHEGGHVLAAWCAEGKVTRVEWPLVGFSRTEVSPNPHPVVEVMSGPVFGAALPVVVCGVLRLMRWRRVSAEIFSGFCLIANGAYLAAGSAGGIGDAGDLLKMGVAMGWLWGIGVPLVALGLWQWHLLGSGFGIGRTSSAERWVVMVAGAGLVVAAAVVEALG